MRILHVITSMGTGGAEALVAQIVPMMRDRGHDVEVALFDGTDTHFKRKLENAGIKVHSFAEGGSVYNPKHIWKLWRLMRKFDLVHTHNYAPQIFAAIGSVLCSVVLCTTEHNTSNRRRDLRWYAPIDRWMYSRYNRVICISQKAEDNLRKFINNKSDKILTINNGIDIATVASATPSTGFEAIAPKSRKILMVAGFRWEKDQDTVIRALKHLPPQFHFFMAGQGVRKQEVENLAETEGVADRVHFLGLRTDVPSLLHEADYLVMSSHFEGLSLSSVEGMAAGKPMLASDVDGLREVVGGAGLLFHHQNATALADAILRLDSNPEEYRRVAEACNLRARDYDISKMVTGYLKVYDELKNKS